MAAPTTAMHFRPEQLASSLVALRDNAAAPGAASALEAALEALAQDTAAIAPLSTGGRGRLKKVSAASEAPPWARSADSLSGVASLLLLAAADTTPARASTATRAFRALYDLPEASVGATSGGKSIIVER
jgi:hypothetical protein